jgi:4-amino-4-deoxy-L-arabinose transferase-like glycosyltransferase
VSRRQRAGKAQNARPTGAAPGKATRDEGPDEVTPSERFPLTWWMPFAVFVPALALSLFDIGGLTFWIMDYRIMIPTATNYARLGLLAPDNWFTQPGTHLLTALFIALFGNDPIGWFIHNPLMNAGSVLLVFLISRRLFGRVFPAVAAAALLALDPAVLNFVRQPTQDIPVAFFLLLMTLFYVRAMESDSLVDWVVAGLAAGVACAIRIYALAPVAVVVVATLTLRLRKDPSIAATVLGCFGALPAAIYLASFLPWAARGNDLGGWLAMQVDAARWQAAGMGPVVPRLAGARDWLYRWVAAGVLAPMPGAYSITMNDPVIWILLLPSAVYLAWRGWKDRSGGSLVVSGTFVLLYALFAVSSRPINLYSALPILPFGFIALGFAADRLLKSKAWWFLGAAVAWSLYLAPAAIGLPLNDTLYGWLLHMVGLR